MGGGGGASRFSMGQALYTSDFSVVATKGSGWYLYCTAATCQASAHPFSLLL